MIFFNRIQIKVEIEALRLNREETSLEECECE